MELTHYSATNEPQRYKWISNYSFGALTEKYMRETGRKNIKSSKVFLDWCVENNYMVKVELESENETL